MMESFLPTIERLLKAIGAILRLLGKFLLGTRSSLLKAPLGEAVLLGNLITLGLPRPGQLIAIDPKTGLPVGSPIPTQPRDFHLSGAFAGPRPAPSRHADL